VAKLLGIHHIAISIPAEVREQAVRFYRDILGFPELPVPDSIVNVPIITWFQVGRNEMHLIQEPNQGGKVRRHLCFEVDDLETFRKRLIDAGEDIEEGELIPGRPRFFCYDPAGNRVEFLVEEANV
jgi:catechol 2,3-dioxygenase-like lactoylglutathione lyase family enzyme